MVGQLLFVLDERVLTPTFCDKKVMIEQAHSLLAAMDMQNIEIRIVPISAAIPLCPMTSFAMYDDTLVTVETLTHEMTVWTDPDVKDYLFAFTTLREGSLPADKTKAFLMGWLKNA